MPTTKPKAVSLEWLQQRILPQLSDPLRQDIEATLREVKQVPKPVSKWGLIIIIRISMADIKQSFPPAALI